MGMMAWAPGPWQDIGDGDWVRLYKTGEAKYGDSYLWAQWRGKRRLLKLGITHQGRETVSREVLEVRHLPTDGEPMAMLDMIAEGVQAAAHEEWHSRAQALLKVYRDGTAHRLRPPAEPAFPWRALELAGDMDRLNRKQRRKAQKAARREQRRSR